MQKYFLQEIFKQMVMPNEYSSWSLSEARGVDKLFSKRFLCEVGILMPELITF